MDRARDFHYVEQYPRRTVAEVETQDTTLDRQVLLNESWVSYCTRLGRADEVADDHTKWVTETWAEYEARVIQRAKYMQEFASQQESLIKANAQGEADRKAKGDRVVAALMRENGARIDGSRLPQQHTLLLDFEDLRAERERGERADLEALEAKHRYTDVVVPEEEARNALRLQLAAEFKALLAQLEAKRAAAEAEAEARREERRRLEEAAREAEERRRQEAEAAERKRREAEEEAKRAERRRKDDERRAKAKAERELARSKARSGLGSNEASLNPGHPGAPLSPSSDNSGGSPFDAVAAARRARMDRQDASLGGFAASIVSSAGADGEEGAADAFCARLVDGASGAGGLLFHGCLYIGLLSEDKTQLEYRYASPNCSSALRSGALKLAADSDAPTAAGCIRDKVPAGPFPVAPDAADGGLVKLDGEDLATLGGGEFFTAPIINEATGTVFGAISLDTATENQRDPPGTLKPAEAACYDPATGKLQPMAGASDHAATTVNITASSQAFIVEMGKRLGAMYEAEAAARRAAQQASSQTKPPEVSALAGALQLPDGGAGYDSMLAFYRDLTKIIGKAIPATQGDVYVGALACPNGDDLTVVAHRGATVNDPASERSISNCLGRQSNREHHRSAPTYAEVVVSKPPRSVHTPDVSTQGGCFGYSDGQPRAGVARADQKTEELLLVPLREGSGSTAAVVGIGALRAGDDADPKLGGEVRKAVEEFLHGKEVRDTYTRLARAALRDSIAAQAVDWITTTTGKANAYIALFRDGPVQSAPLRVSATSAPQEWLKGRQWNSGGVVHPFLTAAADRNSAGQADRIHDDDGSGLLLHVQNVATASAPKVMLLNDSRSGGPEAYDKDQVLAAAVTLRHSGDEGHRQAPIHGALVLDTVGDDKGRKQGFSAADKELAKTTAFLLAEALAETDGLLDEATEQRPMAVEKVVDRRHLLFLAKVWAKVTADVQGITPNQLNEVQRYNNPPPVIHTVCSATCIVLGSKPAVVNTWEKTRKKISQQLLEKMAAFDPTSTRIRKAFSLKARKQIKGLTAHDVFSRGSYPASCFFAWTFVVAMLRRAADSLRKRAAAGTLLLAAGDDAATATTGAADSGDDQEMGSGDDAGDGGATEEE